MGHFEKLDFFHLPAHCAVDAKNFKVSVDMCFVPKKKFCGLSRAAKVRTKSQILLQFSTNICLRIEILKKVSQVGFDLIAQKGRPECLFLGEQKFIYEK